PHHFIFYPLALIIFCVSFYNIFTKPGHEQEWIIITILVFMVTWLSYMLRQHYALTNQDRIVRAELRLRYYQLTQENFEQVEQQLSFGQIAALRFAPDDELVLLIKRAINENLSPKDIKKSIIK